MKTQDTIEIQGIEVFAYHGVYEKEKREGQRFFIDVKLFLALHEAGIADALPKTVNYGDVCEFVRSFAVSAKYDLIEALAENLAYALLIRYEKMSAVEVTVHKPEAPVAVLFSDIAVRIFRQWNEVYLGIGSNMGDKRAYIEDALGKLRDTEFIKDVTCSTLRVTKPYGGVWQDDFLNGAVRLWTLLWPEELLNFLQKLEAEAGRKRDVRWGPRTLDLDILFYGNEVWDVPELRIPHYDLENRDFVLEPLDELCPSYVDPLTGKTVHRMYEELQRKERAAGENL